MFNYEILFFTDFMKTGQMDMENLELNPATSKQLSCPTSQKLKNGSTLQYTWTKDGVDITEDNTVEFIVISADQTLNETLVERSEEHTSELQSPCNLVCRLLLEKKKKKKHKNKKQKKKKKHKAIR